MQYILLLILALFFTACNPTALENSPSPNLPTSVESVPVAAVSESSSETVTISTDSKPVVQTPSESLPQTPQYTDDDDLKVIEEPLIGQYTLQRGLFGTREISEGYLVIEELNPNNYGYYYVTIVGKFNPETHTGIFYNKDGKYIQKIIEDSTEAEIQAGKPKYKMSTIDNLSIKQEDDRLSLRIDSNKHEKLFWVRDTDNNVEKSDKLQKALQEAAYEYKKYYKEKCQELSQFCGDAAYTKVND